MVHLNGRLYVPNIQELREKILCEAHCSKYIIHPRVDKMYKDMKSMYLWKGVKNYVKDYVAKCLICQQVKFKHQSLGGKLQPLDILLWK